MTFYDLNATKRIIKSNGTQALGAGSTPVLPKLTIGGILEKLAVITQSTNVYTIGTGTIARDVNGPYNFYSNMSIIPNQQVPVWSTSGFGAYLFNIVKAGLESDQATIYEYLTATASQQQDTVDITYTNGGSVITAPSGTQNPTFTFPLHMHVTQEMFNGIIGYWELGNPLAQLTVQLIPNYIGTVSPFNVYSTTAGNEPYLVTGNSTITAANPTADIVRFLYDTPVNAADRPPVTFINTIIEDTFQNNVGSATQLKYTFQPLSGYVARVIGYVLNSTTNNGVRPSLMTASNSLTMGIGDGTSLVSESIYETLLRQKTELGFDLPYGTFYLDFLGPDLTWQSVYSTYDLSNVNFTLNFGSALGATSSAKVIKQVLKPLQYTSR